MESKSENTQKSEAEHETRQNNEETVAQQEEVKESTKDEVQSFSTQDSNLQGGKVQSDQEIIPDLLEKLKKATEENDKLVLIHTFEILGREYIRIKKYKDAIDAFTSAYQNAEKEISCSEKLGSLLINISLAYLKNKNTDNAFEYARRGASIESEKNGKTQVLANCYMIMGNACFYKKNLKGAILNYELSYNTQKEITGEQSLEILESTQSLAFAYTDSGDIKNALRFHQEALQVEIKKFGKKDSKLIKRYVAISDLLNAQKKFKDVVSTLIPASEISIEIYGEDNLSVADIFWKIALAYSQMEDFAKCIEVLQNVRKISSRVGGEKYYGLVQIDRAMGQVYLKLNDDEKAEKSFMLGIEVYEASESKDDRNYLHCMLNLARMNFLKEKLKEALSFALKAEMAAKKLGAQDKNYIESKSTVEMILKKMKEQKDSI